MSRATLDCRIRSLSCAAWRRARVSEKKRWRQRAIEALVVAAWRAERVLMRAGNRDGGRCAR